LRLNIKPRGEVVAGLMRGEAEALREPLDGIPSSEPATDRSSAPAERDSIDGNKMTGIRAAKELTKGAAQGFAIVVAGIVALLLLLKAVGL